ncbi:cytochrome bd-I oxidase subunit CydX [Aurantimonas sp. Leaf443]|uniref:cytochrome bd-I oxidase subunit CydX n=1 Tax=Aurantimonas sp. Leaf443 TaxID=1736378 RepID=UPI0006F9F805|nr:cytochrome bd-I oxidase subunit CydX [Aurantimonas sp. Leaf443]KQT84049.1 cytochrome bd biosynthesis protein [Aurantimonas sp. Leaf443]
MWYFSWTLGVGLACAFAILNAMWFEMREDRRLSALPATPSGERADADRTP